MQKKVLDSYYAITFA